MFRKRLRGVNMVNKILRMSSVVGHSGKSRSTIYLRVKAGLFVPPVAIGPRAIGWPEDEVDAINRAHIAGKSDDELRVLVSKLVENRTK